MHSVQFEKIFETLIGLLWSTDQTVNLQFIYVPAVICELKEDDHC